MISVAIIEDNEKEANILKEYFTRFSEDFGKNFRVMYYRDAVFFFADNKQSFDIILMDIDLPNMDGMTAAQKLRLTDQQTVLIFVTNLAQFAVKGYEVNALDFVVKPVKYPNFMLKIKRAVDVAERSSGSVLNIPQANGIRRISSAQICYLEVKGHALYYHTTEEIISGWGSLSAMEEKMKQYHFMRCNNCFLVNPQYIKTVNGYTIVMFSGDELQISHPRRKKFMMELAEYFGKGNL